MMRFPWFLFRMPFLRSRSDAPEPDRIRRVLLTRIQNLGDCAVFVPTVWAVRRFLPDARIDILTGTPVGAALFAMCPAADRILRSRWPSPEGLLAKLDEVEMIRRGRYDVALLSTEETGMAAKMSAAGISFRAGFGVIHHMGETHREPSPHLLGKVLEQPPQAHEVDVNLQLAAAIGATDLEPGFHLDVPTQSLESVSAKLETLGMSGSFCCVHAGTKQAVKMWPSERFAGACDTIAAAGMDVVFIGSASEQQTVEQVRASMRQRSFSLAGQTDVPELAGLLMRASVFLGNDSGPMHLAAAVGTPVAAVFVASDPVVWGPYLPEAKRCVFALDDAEPEAVSRAALALAGASVR